MNDDDAGNVRGFVLADRLPDDLMVVYGRFLATWSELEHRLGVTFWRAIGGSLARAEAIFNMAGGFEVKCTMLERAIAPEPWLSAAPELRSALRRSRRIAQRRNEIVHGFWRQPDAEGYAVTHLRPRAAFWRSYTSTVTVAEVEALRRRTRQIIVVLERVSVDPVKRVAAGP